MKKLLLFLLFTLMIQSVYSQCMLYPLSLQDRVNNSDAVIEAKAIQQNSFWNNSNDFIYTATTLEVHAVYKGNINNSFVTLITEGGTVGNIKIVAEPELQIHSGETGIFFLKPAGNYSVVKLKDAFEGYASSQSLIRFDFQQNKASDPFQQYSDINSIRNQIENLTGNVQRKVALSQPLPSSGNKMLVPPTIGAIAPGTTTAGTFSTITISGSNFGASYVSGISNVEFPDANNGGAGYISAPANHIVSWNNTQIQVWVPTQGGSGNIRVTNNLGETTTSAIAITVNYNETNVVSGGNYYQPDLINDNGTNGYTWAYNTTFNGNAPAVAAFERALQTWRCGTYVNFNRSGTTATTCQALDGNNIVTFDGSCALPSGVLGISYSYYSACASGVWYLNENDLKFRTNGTGGINWNYGTGATGGGQFDFESVCLHELGHSHQLGHTILPVTVMNYAIGPNTDRRTLTPASETAGGNDIMSRSIITNACGPSAMVALNASNCAINAPIADFTGTPLTGCNTLNVTFTDASLNTPTSWTWSFPGGVPNTFSGATPPAIFYGAPGSYSVTLTVSNAFGSNSITKTNYVTVNNCPAPTADFTASPLTICEGSSVQFVDMSSDSPTSWSWTFPGGTPGTSTAQNPLITYSTGGVYNVTLTATNAYGNNTITKNNYITVNVCPPAPVAAFSATPTTLCAGGTVAFTDLSTNSPTSWSWTFTGGTPLSSVAQNPTITYNTPGTYAVTLTATNSGGSNTVTMSGYITVNLCSAPVVSFSGFPTTVCAGQSVTFVDQSTNVPSSWSWTFTGGTPAASAVQNPVITYATAGTYNVSLTASNAFGSNSSTQTNYINVVTCPAPGTGLIVNDGSLIYLQAGAVMHVEGGVINQDNLSNIGTWDNRGQIRIQGDWTNNSTGNAFINSSPGEVELFGANQTIRGTTPTYFYNLTLTGTGIKTQNVDARVEGTLNLNNRELATQGNVMYVTNTSPGAITRTGALNSTPVQGFVSSTGTGRLWRNTASVSNYLFPVGSSVPPARFRPVSIRPLSASANTFGVRMVNNDPNTDGFNRALRDPLLGPINPGWYQKINHVSGTSFAEFSLYADDAQDAITAWALLKLTQWGHNSPPLWWEDIGGIPSGAASPVLGSILRTNWNDFSTTENFNIAPESNPLPVELLSFSAICNKSEVTLNWVTASEVNNSYFDVQHSTDGDNFTTIGKINGKGTTTSQTRYTFVAKAENIQNFYRLIQYDYDGSYKVLPMIAVSCDKNSSVVPLFNLYPNPANDDFISEIILPESSSVRLEVINDIGQLVMEREENLESGYHQLKTNIAHLAKGVYHVHLITDQGKFVKQLVVIK
ncbi:MAG: PKD domain protein [Bacteroidetes bacterium ADurb.Bin141]|nr:MAG: PKD domain protein [Bacteroidetes bacterium ADurb.Bin141]